MLCSSTVLDRVARALLAAPRSGRQTALMDASELLERYGNGQRDFCGALLSGVDLSEANLVGARFAGADLARSCLCGADLSQTNFLRASLIGANLTGALL